MKWLLRIYAPWALLCQSFFHGRQKKVFLYLWCISCQENLIMLNSCVNEKAVTRLTWGAPLFAKVPSMVDKQTKKTIYGPRYPKKRYLVVNYAPQQLWQRKKRLFLRITFSAKVSPMVDKQNK